MSYKSKEVTPEVSLLKVTMILIIHGFRWKPPVTTQEAYNNLTAEKRKQMNTSYLLRDLKNHDKKSVHNTYFNMC